MEKNIDSIKPHLMRKDPHKESESPVCGNWLKQINADASVSCSARGIVV